MHSAKVAWRTGPPQSRLKSDADVTRFTTRGPLARRKPCHWHSTKLTATLKSKHLIQRQRIRPCCSASAQSTCTSTGTVVKTPDDQTVCWGSYISTEDDIDVAIDECIDKIYASIGSDAQPELALVFVSTIHGKEASRVVNLLKKKIPTLKNIFGCTGFGAIGGTEGGPMEVEGSFAVSLTLGTLPGVTVTLKHTLRSGIPTEDDGPEAWEKFLGIQRRHGENLHFMMFADTNFTQMLKIREGLDSAFVNSAKIGGMLSVGVVPGQKARYMFCWSRAEEEAAAREGEKRTRRKTRSAKRAGGSGGLAAASSDKDKEKFSLLGGLVDLLGQGKNMLDEIMEELEEEEEDDDDDVSSGGDEGLFMYGAVIMALQGHIKMDVIVSEGYRFLSNKTWRVAESTRNILLTLVDDGDKEDDPAKMKSALEGILEHLEEIVTQGGMTQDQMQYLVNNWVVALAPDTGYLEGRELTAEDFHPVEVASYGNEGMVMLDMEGDLQKGTRMRLMVKDEMGLRQDLQEKLLMWKRQELSNMMAGRALPTFGALLLTDVERGAEVYEELHVESSMVAGYVPAPVSGVFLTSQFVWQDKITIDVANHAAVAILRAAPAQELVEFDDLEESASEEGADSSGSNGSGSSSGSNNGGTSQ